ncbi:hypothetical protein [Halosimplex salinum]|uniref:hypothetical protein n=1 Tax=Halosimplex salinum TaxID=1710538 RepID=UPI000F47FBEE|nr:hypothetical protein [Halosimplex salinum]
MLQSTALLAERLLPGLLAVGLATIHVVARSEPLFDRVACNRFLSFGGGVSVAYVFVHVLPEVDAIGRSSATDATEVLVTESQVYFVTMAGFVVYYGLERLASRSAEDSGDDMPSRSVFLVHIGSYAAYNGVVGYLLFHQETPGVGNLLLFAVALALHFLLNDVSLQNRHKEVYHTTGRWVLAGAVLVGAAVGAVTELHRLHLGLLFAFLAGAIVLRVVHEELPAKRVGTFWAFAAGVAAYSALLLAV